MAITKLNSLAIPPNTIVESDLSYPLTNFSSTGIDDNATSTAVTIDSSENVGIGTSSPSTKLNVEYGALEAASLHELILNANYGSSSNSGGRIGITFSGNPDGTVGAGQKTAGVYGVSTDTTAFTRSMGLVFNTSATDSNSAERMRIDSSGNVGIGTTSPSTTLHVSGTTGTRALFERTGSIGSYIGLTDSSGSFVYLGDNNGTFEVQTAGSSYATKLAVTSAGNVGIGTSSPSTKLHLSGGDPSIRLTPSSNNDARIDFTDNTGTVRWYTGFDESSGNYVVAADESGFSSSNIVVVDDSGNVGIGTTSPAYVLDVYNSAVSQISASRSGGSRVMLGTDTSTGEYVGTISNTDFKVLTNSTERVRIDSSGNFLVGTTTTVGSTKMVVENTVNGNYVSSFRHTNTSPYGIHVFYSNATPPNNTSNRFIDCEDTGGQRFQVRSNGGIANFQANDANLSDQRAKKDIVASGNYLEKLCNIPVRNFRYNEDAEDSKHHLGVIAQEVEAVAPEFVSKTSWEHKDGPMDTVYNTDLMFAMMKSIQELSAQVTELKAEVAALKGA